MDPNRAQKWSGPVRPDPRSGRKLTPLTGNIFRGMRMIAMFGLNGSTYIACCQVNSTASARRRNAVATTRGPVGPTTSATYKSFRLFPLPPRPRPVLLRRPLTSLAAVSTRTRRCCVRTSDRRRTAAPGRYFTAAVSTGAIATSSRLYRRGPVTSKVIRIEHPIFGPGRRVPKSHSIVVLLFLLLSVL